MSPKWGYSAPNFVLLAEHFLPWRKFSDKLFLGEGNCPLLVLQRRHWTNSRRVEASGVCGLFVWLVGKAASKQTSSSSSSSSRRLKATSRPSSWLAQVWTIVSNLVMHGFHKLPVEPSFRAKKIWFMEESKFRFFFRFLGVQIYLRFSGFQVLVYKEDGTQILRPRKNII